MIHLWCPCRMKNCTTPVKINIDPGAQRFGFTIHSDSTTLLIPRMTWLPSTNLGYSTVNLGRLSGMVPGITHAWCNMPRFQTRSIRNHPKPMVFGIAVDSWWSMVPCKHVRKIDSYCTCKNPTRIHVWYIRTYIHLPWKYIKISQM